MKIAFIVRRFPVISQTFVLNQATGLMDLGHEVDILSFERGDTGEAHADTQKYGLLARTTYLKNPSLTLLEWIRRASFLLCKMLSGNSGAGLSSLNIFRFGRERCR